MVGCYNGAMAFIALLVEYFRPMRGQYGRKAPQQDRLCRRHACQERFFLARHAHQPLILAVANVDESQGQKHLAAGDCHTHEKAHGHAVVKFAHNHGTANRQAAQQHGTPKTGEALRDGPSTHDGKGHEHERGGHGQDRVPAKCRFILLLSQRENRRKQQVLQQFTFRNEKHR